MADKNATQPALRLTILQDPDAERARAQYLEAFQLEDFDDQAIYDRIEDCVFDAIMLDQPVVEMERDIAELMLLVLKKGIRRAKGGQRKTRHQELSKRALIAMAQRIKAELIESGMSATQAHLEAADDAAEEGRTLGLEFTAGSLAREMQRADRKYRP